MLTYWTFNKYKMQDWLYLIIVGVVWDWKTKTKEEFMQLILFG